MHELDIICNKICGFCHQQFIIDKGFETCPDFHMRAWFANIKPICPDKWFGMRIWETAKRLDSIHLSKSHNNKIIISNQDNLHIPTFNVFQGSH
jgi:hypothetical protein